MSDLRWTREGQGRVRGLESHVSTLGSALVPVPVTASPCLLSAPVPLLDASILPVHPGYGKARMEREVCPYRRGLWEHRPASWDLMHTE